MKRTVLLSTLVLLVALPIVVVVAQESAPKPLAEAPPKPAVKKPAVGPLIDRLGADDFAARKKAEKELLKLSKAALPELDKAAKEHADAHVRFESAKIAKRIRTVLKGEKPLAEREGAEPQGAAQDARRRRMEEMIRRLEEQGLLGEKELERLRKALEDEGTAIGGGLGVPQGGAMQGHVISGDRRIEFRRDGEGRVTVKVTEDGETKSYEAESMDELKKKAPEVHALVQKHFGGVQIGGSLFGRGLGRNWPGKDWMDWPDMPGFPRRPQAPKREVPLRERTAEVPGGFRMGIWIGELSEALRVHLKLAKNEGVLVQEVVKGSLADRIGIQRLDVIRKLNGVPVLTAASVRAEVEKVADGGKVTIEIIRKGDALTLVGTR